MIIIIHRCHKIVIIVIRCTLFHTSCSINIIIFLIICIPRWLRNLSTCLLILFHLNQILIWPSFCLIKWIWKNTSEGTGIIYIANVYRLNIEIFSKFYWGLVWRSVLNGWDIGHDIVCGNDGIYRSDGIGGKCRHVSLWLYKS